jgi:lipopolysaccharide heptosyltransferase II
MNINPLEIRKILCIKPRGIGDIVLSTIILDNLKNHFPIAQIHYLTEYFAKPALKNNPLVNKILTMGKTDFPLKVSWMLRKEKYDIVIDLWSNPRSAQITFFSGAKIKVGYAYRGRKYAYNVLGTSSKGETHSAEHNLELLKPLGVEIISKEIHYYIGDEERIFADNYFEANNLNNEKVFGIIPSGGWDSKRCDKQKWVEICQESINKFKCKILILWGPGDVDDAEFIKQNLGNDCLLAPKSSLTQLAGLISKCNLIIANDSGPMHIAAALKVPTLGIFGPTNPKAHRPYSPNSDYIIKEDLHCIICNKLVCPYQHECMTQLDVNVVLKKIKALLNEKV